MKNKLASKHSLLCCSGHEPFHLDSVFQTTYLPHQEDEEKIIKRGCSLFRQLASSLQRALSQLEERRSTTEEKQSLLNAQRGNDAMVQCYWTERTRFTGLTRNSAYSQDLYLSFSYLILLFLSLSLCLFAHLYYHIYVSAEHAYSIAYYNFPHTNHLKMMIPVPFETC